ncbi:MAG: hypothetical protein ABI856_15135 [Nitrospira sp.]
MPGSPRLATEGLAYHVPYRRTGRLPSLENSADYAAFETILAESRAHATIRIAS